MPKKKKSDKKDKISPFAKAVTNSFKPSPDTEKKMFGKK